MPRYSLNYVIWYFCGWRLYMYLEHTYSSLEIINDIANRLLWRRKKTIQRFALILHKCLIGKFIITETALQVTSYIE